MSPIEKSIRFYTSYVYMYHSWFTVSSDSMILSERTRNDEITEFLLFTVYKWYIQNYRNIRNLNDGFNTTKCFVFSSFLSTRPSFDDFQIHSFHNNLWALVRFKLYSYEIWKKWILKFRLHRQFCLQKWVRKSSKWSHMWSFLEVHELKL